MTVRRAGSPDRYLPGVCGMCRGRMAVRLFRRERTGQLHGYLTCVPCGMVDDRPARAHWRRNRAAGRPWPDVGPARLDGRLSHLLHVHVRKPIVRVRAVAMASDRSRPHTVRMWIDPQPAGWQTTGLSAIVRAIP